MSNPTQSYHCYLEDTGSIPGGGKNLFAILSSSLSCLKNLSILALPFTYDNCPVQKNGPIVISEILTT